MATNELIITIKKKDVRRSLNSCQNEHGQILCAFDNRLRYATAITRRSNHLSGAKLENFDELKNKINEKISKWKKAKTLDVKDFMLFIALELRLRASEKNNNRFSYYLTVYENKDGFTLRISDHHFNARTAEKTNDKYTTSVTFSNEKPADWDYFKADPNVKAVEYVYYEDKVTKDDLISIAKDIIEFVETGKFTPSVKPNEINESPKPKNLSGIDDKYRAFLAEHEDWHRCIVDDYTFIDKPNKSKKVSHGYIQRQAKAENKADGERFCEETEQLFSNIISLFPGWATPDPIIRYTPKQGLYYRQLRFTYDENDKFLQVIPEFLAMINADMSKFEFVFDKFSAAKAKCCKFEYDNSSATPLPGSLAEPQQKNKKTSSYKFDYDAAIISFIGTLDSPEAKRTPRYKIKSDFERFYKDLFPKEITEDITDTIDYDWVEANVFGGRTREIYDYTKGNNGDDFSKLVILTSIYYKRLCAECGVMPSAEVDDITIIPKIILDESKLVKLNYSPVSPLTLTESEKESLRHTGSYVSDDDFEYLEKVAKQIKLSVQQGDKKKKISIQDAISILGRKEFWSGIYRAAYHGTATRGNKEPYVLFALPSNLKGLSDINPKLELTDNKDIYEAKGDFYYKRYNGRVQPKKYHSYLLLLHKYMNYFKLINTTPKYYILRQVRLIDNNFYLKKNENNIIVDSATWENHFTPITNNDKRYNIFREIENAGLILSDKESKAWNKYNATMRYYGSKFQFGDFVDIVDSYYNSRTLAIISGIHETKKDVDGDRFLYDFTYVNYNNPTYHYNEYDATHGHSSLYEKYIQETTQLDKAKDFVKREIEYRKSMEELDNELQPIINATIDEALNNTFSVGNYICYKGIEESIFQIVGFKGNNYIVIEFGDRTRTKNEIPFADKDKLQKVLPPILKHEAMLASSKRKLSGISGVDESTPKITDKGDDFSYFNYPKDVIDKFYTYIRITGLDKKIPAFSNYFFDDDGHLCFATSRKEEIKEGIDVNRCLKAYEDGKQELISKAESMLDSFIWDFFMSEAINSPKNSYDYKLFNRELVELLLGYARKFEETSKVYPQLSESNLQKYNKTKEILSKRLADLNKPKQPKKTPTIPTIQPEKLLTFDRNRLSMSCVHCENGYKVVTDAHFILKFKSDYPKQYEGKNVMPKHFFKKFEEFILNPETVLFCNEDSYPNYEPVIKNTLAKTKYSASIDIQSLYQYICALTDYYEKQTGEEIKIENRHLVPFFYNGQHAFTLDIVRLKKWLSAAKLIQADTIKWVDYSYGVVFQNSKSDNGDILLVMPSFPRDTDKSITDGKCLIDVDWDIWYKPYDFANTRKANILITEAKLCTLRKTAEKRTPPPSMSEIVAILDSHEFSGEPYTDADKEKLSQYQGIGGKGKEHGANVGILNQYFTPVWVCECMYKLAKHYGFNGGNILEPSAATGNMIKPFYDRGDYNHIDAFEIDKLTAKICKILYPDVEVMNQYFETAFLEYPRFTTKARQPWLKNYPYDLVIGNPPYGIHKNLYSGYFSGKDHFQQIEMFFIYKGLQMLKKDGLLIYITSINFMSTGLKTYAAAKKQIGELAEFVDAYRLPSVFDNTSICTDIIVLRKK